MDRTVLFRTAAVGLAVVALSIGVVAQSGTGTTSLEGSINDFTPTLGSSGPWHVAGNWSLKLKGQSGKVDFAAALGMVRSDLWVLNTAADADNPAARAPHTHHVQVTDADVTPISNGFRISGTARITSNGALAGFSGSQVEIEITGSGDLPFANVKLTFLGAAATHFGAQALEGVVITAR